MRDIVRSSRFKRDYRRELRGRHGGILERELRFVLEHLVIGQPLPDRYRDHQLGGEWRGCRDCHLRPDLVLLYRIFPDRLELVRLGSHAELGLK